MSPSREKLKKAIIEESKKFQETYLWLEQAMPEEFFREISHENLMLITHNLMGFHLQDYFSTIHLKNGAIVMCLDDADANLRILKDYAMYGIRNFQAYVSNSPLSDINVCLRIGMLFFTEAYEEPDKKEYPQKALESLKAHVMERNKQVTEENFDNLLDSMSSRFLHALTAEKLVSALDMFFRAKTRDNCQYEVYYNENWKKNGEPSMDIMLAWRNTPKHNFLYRLVRVINRHGLVLKRVNSSYIDPYGKQNILIMALSIHGDNGKAAWDVANIQEFLRNLVTVKYFASFDQFDKLLVNKKIIPGVMGNYLRAVSNFVHQILVHVDLHQYTLENIEEALCRHPDLTKRLTEAFRAKFDPLTHNYVSYMAIKKQYDRDVEKLDTGHVEYDNRRKMVLRQAMNFLHHTLKTNFFRHNYTAISFRLNPAYLEHMPFDRKEKFPVLPFGIIYIKGMHYFGFHIRFKDLARGGLRTVFLKHPEQMFVERNRVFSECYHLAYTQHKKNKDIPEGGSKGIIFLKPFSRLESETAILKKELKAALVPLEETKEQLKIFIQEQNEEHLHQAQRSFIESLITIINTDEKGKLRAKHMVDYLKKPEYLYLGPDENMHDTIIDWIAHLSIKYNYRPGAAFISGKTKTGINHKEFGITSLGINVYMEKLLLDLGIDPKKNSFTVKMSGGPDGDVAGNQILNLHRYYKNTAKLIALIDVSGTIFDPKGLDLNLLKKLFYSAKPIKFYPPNKLHEGGFLIDKAERRRKTTLIQQTLCWKKEQGKVIKQWLPGSEANHLLRHTVHSVKADIFIPAGGRPRTLNHSNVEDFLDDKGLPTAKGIVEGANLYFDNYARQFLEEKGALIIQDSSANKAGVICSSFEILCGLAISDSTFVSHKERLVKEILTILHTLAAKEADLLLRTRNKTEAPLTKISHLISDKINGFTYELLDYLDKKTLKKEKVEPLIEHCFFPYMPPLLREEFSQELLTKIPEHHIKAIIACQIASKMVYTHGLDWKPSIVDILPLIITHHEK